MNLSKHHIKSINKALSYIHKNLESNLSLDNISKTAHFSPFHFHRIFKAFTKETLNQYIVRKRLEKASAVLLKKKNVTILELYLQFGFTSNSSFTRAFKTYYVFNTRNLRIQGNEYIARSIK